MEVDPQFVGPAALAKAYRFVGDPRDGARPGAPRGPVRGPARHLRLHPLLQVRRRLPQGRRADEPDHAAAADRRVRRRRSTTATTATATRRAFVDNIRKNGLLHEADLLPDSYGGKFHPRAVPELVESLPAITTALLRRKVTPSKALLHPHRKEYKGLRRIFDEVEGRDDRRELNLYVIGVEDEPVEKAAAEEERGPASDERDGQQSDEGRLLARLRLARLHPRAARLDGNGRAAARHRAGRARSRQLLRRRRDRRAQPGACRHAQRAHVRAGTADRRRADDEHLLDLPGLDERVPGAPRRAAPSTAPRSTRPCTRTASATSKGIVNKNFLWVLVEDIGLDSLEALVKRPLETCASARSTAATSCARATGSASTTTPPRDTLPRAGDRGARRHRDRLRGRLQVLRLPDHHDEQADVAQAGRTPPRRRRSTRTPTAWSRPARSATSTSTCSSRWPRAWWTGSWTCRCSTSPSSSASRSGSTPRSWAWRATWSSPPR